jgi:Peptidase_C39 like family
MTWREEGGRGWCSPTSVAMVLAHAGRLPAGTDVPHAAAEVLDPTYGAGNWSFNAAWAATLTGNAFVTRLRDLRDAERFIDAGVPLVASVAYPPGALRGAPTHATDGHLVVIRGFTASGDVVTNDPGAPTDRSVRRTYDRGQFERAWLGGSGGLVYVIHRDDRSLPAGSRGAW